jgi:hypothetical protein
MNKLFVMAVTAFLVSMAGLPALAAPMAPDPGPKPIRKQIREITREMHDLKTENARLNALIQQKMGIASQLPPGSPVEKRIRGEIRQLQTANGEVIRDLAKNSRELDRLEDEELELELALALDAHKRPVGEHLELSDEYVRRLADGLKMFKPPVMTEKERQSYQRWRWVERMQSTSKATKDGVVDPVWIRGANAQSDSTATSAAAPAASGKHDDRN